MPKTNPLVVLGLPQGALAHEVSAGNWSRIRELAEAQHRLLAKTYHPDRDHGDADLMAMFSGALEELSHPDDVKFYARELVGRTDVQMLRERRAALSLVDRDTRALQALAEGFQFFDQQAMLGITVPTTFMAAFDGQRMIIDVSNASSARVRITDLHDQPEEMAALHENLKVEYHEGSWSEAYYRCIRPDHEVSLDHECEPTLHWHRFVRFSSDESAKLVGFVPSDVMTQTGWSSDRAMLESPQGEVRIDWQEPKHCWFLSELRYSADAASAVRCVLYRGGRFAITDMLLGGAPL